MSHVSFLGIPVEGKITRGHRVPQRPLEELRPLLRALLDDEAVTEFGWRQYTPYFNDGEPCVFGVQEVWVRTTGDGPGADPHDLQVGEYANPHPSLGGRRWASAGPGPYRGDDEPRYQRAYALAEALEAGSFDDVLVETFGDHADVTVRREGIQVQFYEHD
ncbi:hypothetical protein NCC78_15210 [Micromonospora phytophila]|uniref:hypothetical protein n=1 Tax=Micromonospora phytophila TaxID=709888 RepID=UPI00202E2DD5|nr:hypothetical protein [Micromonospora phytophila]MCM0676029.1 hypothetical protein [Micromonospora phytophila]